MSVLTQSLGHHQHLTSVPWVVMKVSLMEVRIKLDVHQWACETMVQDASMCSSTYISYQ
jgi:hypothetical protein